MMYGGGADEDLEIRECLRSMLIYRVKSLKKLSDNAKDAADSKTV